MKSETLLCFGGPRDGELLAVARPDVVLVPVFPEPAPASLMADPIDVPDPVRYNVERVYLHDDSEHWGAADMHGDWCTMTARCLVAEGYPKHRITDALTAVARFVSIAPFTPWGVTAKIASRSGEQPPPTPPRESGTGGGTNEGEAP